MTTPVDLSDTGEPETGAGVGASTMSPLPGEPGIPNIATAQRRPMSSKGLFALVLLLGSLIAVSAVGIQRFSASGRKAGEAENALTGNKPSAATAEPRRLDLAQAGAGSASGTTEGTGPRIPALVPEPDETEPIGVRRTGAGAPVSGNGKTMSPEDAPILLVSSRPTGTTVAGTAGRRPDTASPPTEAGAPAQGSDPADPLAVTSRNLEAYQRQLQGLLDSLSKTGDLGNAAGGPMPSGASDASGGLLGGPLTTGHVANAPVGGLFGGQLQSSATPRVVAGTLGDRSLVLAKGTAFTCALKTRLISAASGLVGCQVQRNVFSDDGRVLLIERGSHLDGEYRIASVRPGMVRIPVLWTRIRTPLGVTVDIDSPATGPLGESGIAGYVDNRWGERIGAAMLLSLIDDSVKLVIQNQASSASADRRGDTIVLPSTTANTSKLAEKVLDSTINIPPLVYQNQGGIVGIYVARDVDFSSVYELRPTTR